MGSKIGVHLVIGPRRGFGEFLQTTKGKLPVVKCVDDFGAATEAKALDQNALTVGRVNEARHYETGQMVDMTAWEPRGPYKERTGAVLAAHDYYQTVKPYWGRNPQIDVWETFNEFSFHWEWQGWFYIAMMDLAEPDGYTLAHYACSSGNPGTIAFVNGMVESLREAKRRGHYLSLHSYGGVGTDIKTLKGTEPFHALRYRQTYNDVLIPANANPPLILSEIGQAGGFDYLGWDMLGPDLEWYDNELAKDEYVVGATLFTLGRWYQSNYQDALPQLAQHIVNFVPDTTPPPVDPPEEKRVYSRHVVLIPQKTTELEDAEIANRYASTVSIFRSADDAFIAPGPDWPTQIDKLTVDTWAVERVSKVDGQQEAEDALNNFIDTYHPVRETDIDFTLNFFEYGGTQPLPPLPLKFWLDSPIEGVPSSLLVVTGHFDDPRPYGKHEGLDLQSYDHSVNVARHILAPQDGEVYRMYPVGSVDSEYMRGYGNYIILRHPGPWEGDRVYYTWHCHLKSFEQGLVVGQQVERGDTIALSGKSGTGTTAIHLHDTLQEFALGGNGNEVAMGKPGYIVPSVADPEPFYLPGVPTTPPPVGNAWAGLHLQHHINEGTVQDEITTIATGRVEAVKFNTNANIERGLNPLLASGVDPSKMVMRLYMAGDSPTLKVPADFVDVMAIHLDWLKSVTMISGGGYVEIHNEPNLTDEGFGFAWNSPREFHEWLLKVAMELKGRWPTLKFGYPGLSPKPEVNAWLDDLKSNDNLLSLLDWIGIHAYWVDALRMFDSEHGGYYKRYVARFPNHDLLITEFSHKAAIKQGELSKGDQYVKYYAGLPPEIKAAYSYITVDGNYPLEQWMGTNIAARVGAR